GPSPGKPPPSLPLRAARGSRTVRGVRLRKASAFQPCQSLESRVPPQGGVIRVDPQEAGRDDVVRESQERLENIDRLLRLADEAVDPRQQLQHVRSVESLAGDRPEGAPALPFPNRLVSPAEVGERQAEVGAKRGVLRRSPDLLLESLSRFLRVAAGGRRV